MLKSLFFLSICTKICTTTPPPNGLFQIAQRTFFESDFCTKPVLYTIIIYFYIHSNFPPLHTAQFLKVDITYRDKPLTQKFYDEHPEIQKLYPSKEDFLNKLYIPLFQKAKETQSEQTLEISEHSIKINGEVVVVG